MIYLFHTIIVNVLWAISGALITAQFMKKEIDVNVEWGKDTCLKQSSACSTNNGICRYLARLVPNSKLYGSNTLEETEIDHWLSFSIGPITCSQKFNECLQYLDYILGPVTYLVGNQVTIADFTIWGTLHSKFLC